MDPFEQMQKEIHDVFATALDAALKSALEQSCEPYRHVEGDAKLVLDVLVYNAMHEQLAMRVGGYEVLISRNQNITLDELRERRDQAIAKAIQLAQDTLDANTH